MTKPTKEELNIELLNNGKYKKIKSYLFLIILFLLFSLGIYFGLKKYKSNSVKTPSNDKLIETCKKDYSKYDFIADDSTFYLKYPDEIQINDLGEITVQGTNFNYKEIKKISLGGLGFNSVDFKEFPYEILEFENLEYLFLGMRGFNYLPDEIIKLKNLKVLDLQHSLVEELSPNITRLENLAELILLYSNIQNLPEEFENLSKLKRLHLGCTNFNNIPKQLYKMNWLETLTLTNANECDDEYKLAFYNRKDVKELASMLPNTNIRIRINKKSY